MSVRAGIERKEWMSSLFRRKQNFLVAVDEIAQGVRLDLGLACSDVAVLHRKLKERDSPKKERDSPNSLSSLKIYYQEFCL